MYEAGKKRHESSKLQSAMKKIEEASVVQKTGFENVLCGQLKSGELKAFKASLDT